MDAELFPFFARAKFIRIYPEWLPYKVLSVQLDTGIMNLQPMDEDCSQVGSSVDIDLNKYDMWQMLLIQKFKSLKRSAVLGARVIDLYPGRPPKWEKKYYFNPE